ncbi:MAG: hypothetical protein JO055_00420 [Alphaproteobacteria bacterium]|nr:hypothetical protein [Alphaproteobacteria bacterium]
MPTSVMQRVLSAGVIVAGLTIASLAWAETKPPPTPAGQGAAPSRTPAKGKGWFVPDMDSDQSGMVRSKTSPKTAR